MEGPSLSPPDNQTAEAWLVRYDNKPTLLPVWSTSDKLAWVCVRDSGGEDTEAVVALSPSHLDTLADVECGLRRLFFLVPKNILFAPGVCPELTHDSFLA